MWGRPSARSNFKWMTARQYAARSRFSAILGHPDPRRRTQGPPFGLRARLSPFGRHPPILRRSLDRDALLLPAGLRQQTVQIRRRLWVDANQGYTPDEALRQAGTLEALGVAVLEQPVPADAISGLQRLVLGCPIPVALDESLRDPAELVELARLGAVGGVILKVQRSGGLYPGRAMVAVAEAARLPLFGSGLCETDVGRVASLHRFAAAGVAVPVDLNGRQFVECPFARGLEIGPAGRARVPDGPGLRLRLIGLPPPRNR